MYTNSLVLVFFANAQHKIPCLLFSDILVRSRPHGSKLYIAENLMCEMNLIVKTYTKKITYCNVYCRVFIRVAHKYETLFVYYSNHLLSIAVHKEEIF